MSKKYSLGILTNGPGDLQRQKLKILGIEKYFTNVIIGGELGFYKPSKRIFQYALRQVNNLPSEVLMIGDDLEQDIIPAKGVGIRGIFVARKMNFNTFESSATAKVEYITLQLHEILRLL